MLRTGVDGVRTGHSAECPYAIVGLVPRRSASTDGRGALHFRVVATVSSRAKRRILLGRARCFALLSMTNEKGRWMAYEPGILRNAPTRSSGLFHGVVCIDGRVGRPRSISAGGLDLWVCSRAGRTHRSSRTTSGVHGGVTRRPHPDPLRPAEREDDGRRHAENGGGWRTNWAFYGMPLRDRRACFTALCASTGGRGARHFRVVAGWIFGLCTSGGGHTGPPLRRPAFTAV